MSCNQSSRPVSQSTNVIGGSLSCSQAPVKSGRSTLDPSFKICSPVKEDRECRATIPRPSCSPPPKPLLQTMRSWAFKFVTGAEDEDDTANVPNSESCCVMIDTDCGVDDALGILLALCTIDCDILAITCVYGEVTVEQTTRNVLRVLGVCQTNRCKRVPVYKGCENPILGVFENNRQGNISGNDGLGGIANELACASDTMLDLEEHACLAMIRLVNSRPGEVILVTMGPLTNAAIAQKLDPTFSSKLKGMYIMGGNIQGKGNLEVTSEFNFGMDPEAAAIVLNEFECHKTIVPMETCHKHYLPWEWYCRMTQLKDPRNILLGRLTQYMASIQKEVRRYEGFVPYALYAMTAALYPEVVQCSRRSYSTVELTGEFTRGQMVTEFRPWVMCKGHNADIVVDMNICALLALYERRVFLMDQENECDCPPDSWTITC